jgi:hypothetical protein
VINPKSQSGNRSKQRVPARLSATVDKKLLAYASAASAAGVGVLALASSAEAKIIYTPASLRILPSSNVNLDINNDGTNDFQFSDLQTSTHARGGKLVVQGSNAGNSVWGTKGSVAALPPGVPIGPKGQFEGKGSMVRYGSVCCSTTRYSFGFVSTGAWGETTSLYLGLKFVVQGDIHYGWARLSVTATARGIYGLVTGYAYETVANKSIVTGKTKGAAGELNGSVHASPAALGTRAHKPASLGLLAQGAAGLDLWRRRNALDDTSLRVDGEIR